MGPLLALEVAPDVLVPVEDREHLVVGEAEHCGEGNGRTLALEDVSGAGGGHQDSGVTTIMMILTLTSEAGDRDTGKVPVRYPV